MPITRHMDKLFASLEQRMALAGQGDRSSSLRSTPTLSRFMAGTFAVAATIALVSMVVPQPPGTNEEGLYALYGVAYALAALLFWRAETLGSAALAGALACGTGLVCLGIVFTSDRAGVYGLFFVWIALTAFYFFSLRSALAQVALIGVGYAAVLAHERPAGLEEQWVITVGTVLGVGVLVGVLRARVERLLERLFEASRTDPLTELRNRRGFQEQLETELERSRLTSASVSLVVADLDHFKNVNDKLGHQEGDRVLRRFAAEMTAAKRGMDGAARLGGEEFAVILPETDKQSAYLFAERLRRAAHNAFVGEPVPITVSLGVTAFPVDAPTAEGMLGTADQALYAAKELGRDRSVLFNSEIVSGLMSEQASSQAREEGQLAAVLVLAETLDARDPGTGRRSERVGRLAALTARELGLSEAHTEQIRLAGLLHDVGKIGMPDSLLGKPGALSEAERAEMQTHPDVGARILAGAHLDDIAEWVRAHHEHPDGTGYPLGRKAEHIPLEARVLSAADTFDSLVTDGPEQPAVSAEHAARELLRLTPDRLDADVVRALLAVVREDARQAEPSAGLS